jgi:hypothetical protein
VVKEYTEVNFLSEKVRSHLLASAEIKQQVATHCLKDMLAEAVGLQPYLDWG